MNAKSTARPMPSMVEKQAHPSRGAALYPGLITLVGLIVTSLALMNLPQDRWGLILFASLAVIAELGSVESSPAAAAAFRLPRLLPWPVFSCSGHGRV